MWPLKTSTTYELCSTDALARLQCRFTVNPYNHIGSSVISFAAIKGLLIAFKLVRACCVELNVSSVDKHGSDF